MVVVRTGAVERFAIVTGNSVDNAIIVHGLEGAVDGCQADIVTAVEHEIVDLLNAAEGVESLKHFGDCHPLFGDSAARLAVG